MADATIGARIQNDEICLCSKANKVHVRYCDGASFLGAREDAVDVGMGNTSNILHFRGEAILEATLATLAAASVAIGSSSSSFHTAAEPARVAAPPAQSQARSRPLV